MRPNPRVCGAGGGPPTSVPEAGKSGGEAGGRSAAPNAQETGGGRHLVTGGSSSGQQSMQSYNHIQAMVPLENHHQPPAHQQPECLGVLLL